MPQAILPIVSSGGRWSGEFFVRRKGGGTVRVLTNLWPLTDPGGEVVGVVGESEEVTAERLLDAELRARGESLLLGLQDGNLGSWYWDTTTGQRHLGHRRWKRSTALLPAGSAARSTTGWRSCTPTTATPPASRCTGSATPRRRARPSTGCAGRTARSTGCWPGGR